MKIGNGVRAYDIRSNSTALRRMGQQNDNFLYVCVRGLNSYYGEECLEDITLSPFSPDNFLFVNEEFDELFHDFALHAGDNVVW